ncbi:hypothetical protein [Nonomuraea sp. NPDC049480]|uniref:hypothetical protein n=1 Tax=Nonomuraea sp. NPDC049480 TaxID=3364353 RepID=UPI0037A8AEC2
MTRRLLLVPICVLLSGCFASSATTQADHEQLEVMLSQPFVREAIDKPSTRVAFQKSDRLPATRGMVTAVLADQPAAAPADDARQWAAKGMQKLRDSGWTVYATVCLPPRKSDDPNPPQEGAWDAWSFTAHAYKVVDGVSYFAIAEGLGQLPGSIEMYIEMRAPSSREPVSDLFPERPPPLPVGASCVEAGGLPAKKVINGPAVVMGESGPGQAGKEPRNDNVR